MNHDLPDTIARPDEFLRTAPPAFDGAFDWAWTKECWGNPRDTPMDIDGFKERRGQCLIFETKSPGVPIKDGQMFGLKALHRTGVVSVMLVWGKRVPEYGDFWFPASQRVLQWRGVDQARDLVRRWYRWADRQF